jgi:histidinol-phosphatase (PHP family)
MSDLHTHTHYSDGTASPAAMVAAAQACGLDVLAITDHLTLPASMDPACEVSIPEGELPAYYGELSQLQHELGKKNARMRLIAGVECDWYPECEANIERWAAQAQFKLGSVHWICNAWLDDPSDRSLYERYPLEELYEAYTQAFCAACASSAHFDVMAHPDLIRRFSEEDYAPTFDLTPYFERMVAAAQEAGVHVEVSTAALRKGLPTCYPHPALLEGFCKAGVPITVASDAHCTQDVGASLAGAHAYAYAHGYRTHDVFFAPHTWVTCEL